ncbi:hypothetical protein AVEN_44865-1 [Araneus ventricosus]|uniref:Uncharacterized protein n=1 Tax=Araneus ventricosus TaxID=182803 RepID=A0A4Y2KAD6_ARAVE|nr:hypothetical protein AVEN_44865-1 [Araneus ventricosus]
MYVNLVQVIRVPKGYQVPLKLEWHESWESRYRAGYRQRISPTQIFIGQDTGKGYPRLKFSLDRISPTPIFIGHDIGKGYPWLKFSPNRISLIFDSTRNVPINFIFI